MSVEQVKTPDIGGDSGEVIEILVAVGDLVEAEQSLLVLESAKASMEVPSPQAGKVTKIYISLGDSLEEGAPILDLEVQSSASEPKKEETVKQEKPAVEAPQEQQPDAKPQANSESSQTQKIPDVGSDTAEIIEVSVKVGDTVSSGDTLVVAESEKASMDIPSEFDGRVETLHVKEGDQIVEGQDLVTILIARSTEEPEAERHEAAEKPQVDTPTKNSSSDPEIQSGTVEKTFQVPDLGSEMAEIIEISVAVGDRVKAGDALVVAESDKASLEVPAEAEGEILVIHCAVGDKISQGNDLVTLKVIEESGAVGESPTETEIPDVDVSSPTSSDVGASSESEEKTAVIEALPTKTSSTDVYAGPAVRKQARELGVDLAQVRASGPRGRILKDDLHSFVKTKMKEPASSGAGVPSIAAVDWEKFGSVRVEATSRIHRLTAENMLRSWLNVPHVTQFDDADVTELEEYRAMMKHEGVARGIKMTPLAFILKASYKALKNNPKFNAALSVDAENLIFRDYFHIGVAVDTPSGLMVPVIRDVDKKDIWQLAAEIAELAEKAKNAKLKPTEMQGACFTVSSLGAIGGRGFTPIVPAPQVGILGVSKTAVQPLWDGEEFQPRKMMPLALSYDHRAVNGVDAGKFLTYLVEQLSAVENIWSD